MKGNCIVCGKEIERSPSSFSKTGKVFCSHECNQAHHFKIRSKITNCIICKNELKPGEGWALSNLRPMWARENIAKSDKIEKPMQPSLSWFDFVPPPKVGRPATRSTSGKE